MSDKHIETGSLTEKKREFSLRRTTQEPQQRESQIEYQGDNPFLIDLRNKVDGDSQDRISLHDALAHARYELHNPPKKDIEDRMGLSSELIAEATKVLTEITTEGGDRVDPEYRQLLIDYLSNHAAYWREKKDDAPLTPGEPEYEIPDKSILVFEKLLKEVEKVLPDKQTITEPNTLKSGQHVIQFFQAIQPGTQLIPAQLQEFIHALREDHHSQNLEEKRQAILAAAKFFQEHKNEGNGNKIVITVNDDGTYTVGWRSKPEKVKNDRPTYVYNPEQQHDAIPLEQALNLNTAQFVLYGLPLWEKMFINTQNGIANIEAQRKMTREETEAVLRTTRILSNKLKTYHGEIVHEDDPLEPDAPEIGNLLEEVVKNQKSNVVRRFFKRNSKEIPQSIN